jgi:hypothetical protein
LKKAITILLALVYFGTSIGATIHMHYCMGEITGWGLTVNASQKCGKCGMEKSVNNGVGCCKDEIKVIKNNSDQKTNPTVTLRFISFDALALTPVSPVISSGFLSAERIANPVCNAPPRPRPIAGYIFFRSFLI